MGRRTVLGVATTILLGTAAMTAWPRCHADVVVPHAGDGAHPDGGARLPDAPAVAAVPAPVAVTERVEVATPEALPAAPMSFAGLGAPSERTLQGLVWHVARRNVPGGDVVWSTGVATDSGVRAQFTLGKQQFGISR
jgi:hypothetical protein